MRGIISERVRKEIEMKWFHDGKITLHAGDCLGVLKALLENSIDAVVTDPPYHLTSIVKRFGGSNAAPAKGNDAYIRASKGFMNKTWDGGDIAFRPELWAEVLRVLKPGGHMIAFSGCRTYHKMTCAIEDAGFEIRDMLSFIFGSGFPKSHSMRDIGRPELGTALKPAHEPICLARKPLSESTVAANVLRWGTGALNIDGCRIEASRSDVEAAAVPERSNLKMFVGDGIGRAETRFDMSKGRWPANLCHDGSPEVLAGFPETTSGSGNKNTNNRLNGTTIGDGLGAGYGDGIGGDSGSAARFFYTAKADANDRLNSKHPTVKPVDLMQWLVRLVCPKGATVLDPFAGTGTTGAAAFIEGRRCVLIEREAEYLSDIERRMGLLLSGPDERARKLAQAESYETLPLFA